MEWARANGYVVFTHDLDIGTGHVPRSCPRLSGLRETVERYLARLRRRPTLPDPLDDLEQLVGYIRGVDRLPTLVAYVGGNVSHDNVEGFTAIAERMCKRGAFPVGDPAPAY